MDVLVYTVRASECLALVFWIVFLHKCARFQNSQREQLKVWTCHRTEVTSKLVSPMNFGLFIS